MLNEGFGAYVAILAPPAFLLLVCYLVVRYLIEADRRERAAHARWRAEHPSPIAEKQGGDATEK